MTFWTCVDRPSEYDVDCAECEAPAGSSCSFRGYPVPSHSVRFRTAFLALGKELLRQVRALPEGA